MEAISISTIAAPAPDAIDVGGKRRGRKRGERWTLHIAVVGAGAVRSYYGWRLWEGGARASLSLLRCCTGGGVVDDRDDDRDIGTSVAFRLTFANLFDRSGMLRLILLASMEKERHK